MPALPPPWVACVLLNLVSCLTSAGLPWWPLASAAALSFLD